MFREIFQTRERCHTPSIAFNDNNSFIALYPVQIYELVALYIININSHLTIRKQVL